MPIRIYLDDEPAHFQEIENAQRFSFDTTGLPDGVHKLRFETVDPSGNITGFRDVPFTVRNGPGISVAGLRPGDEIRGNVSVLVNATDAGIDRHLDVHAMETHRGIPFWMGGFALAVILCCAVYLATDPFRHRDYDTIASEAAATPTGSTAELAAAKALEKGGTAKPQSTSPMALKVAKGDFLPLLPIHDKLADAQKGSVLFAAKCSGCHGAVAQGTVQEKVTLADKGIYPRLAGQDRTYIYRQLTSFAEGWRDSAQMKPMALSLSEQDKLDVAAHIEGLDPPYPPQENVADDILALGLDLATHGRPGQGVSRCSACHGENGGGGGANFPWLMGQNADYLAAQIYGFREGVRRNSWMQLMQPVAHGLTDQETQAVAAYYAHLRPGPGLQAAGTNAQSE